MTLPFPLAFFHFRDTIVGATIGRPRAGIARPYIVLFR